MKTTPNEQNVTNTRHDSEPDPRLSIPDWVRWYRRTKEDLPLLKLMPLCGARRRELDEMERANNITVTVAKPDAFESFNESPTPGNAVRLAIADHRGAGRIVDWQFVDALNAAAEQADEFDAVKRERNELRAIALRLTRLCPSREGMGGHAPMGAFTLLAEDARKALGANVEG